MLLRELSPGERAEAVDRRHAVNVDGVHVVDVVMHAPGHGQKLRDHRQEEPHVVQLADDRPAPRLGVSATVAHELDEEPRAPRGSSRSAAHHAGSPAARAMASRA